MNKKKFAFLSLMLCCVALLTSCLFESDDSALSSWLSDQGMPDSYKVQTVSIDGISPLSAEVFLDSAPSAANSKGVFGYFGNISHDLILDVAFDTTMLSSLNGADSAASILFLHLLNSYYGSEYFPEDSLPIEEELKINVSWILTRSESISFLSELSESSDSVWMAGLPDWNPDASADTTYSVSIGESDTLMSIVLPSALIDSIRSEVKYTRLQMRISAPEAKHVYRVYGPDYNYGPQFRMATLTDTTHSIRTMTAFRMAEMISSRETCSDCLTLHGGIFDSLVVEFPSAPIMEKLAEFYGDDFPYNVGDGGDVRQAVVLAQVTFSRDDSQGVNELGRPIQVVVGSFVDSAETTIRKMESYKLDREKVLEEGHPNMVFHDGDSLTLQVTYGMRDFINKAEDGRTFKFMMRLGYPVLQEKDSTYSNYITADGDTSYVFFSHFDYARYDFSQSMKNPATIKLWLASKRGDEE